MRKPIIAGNWKMHKTAKEAAQLVLEMRETLEAIPGIDVVLIPPSVCLSVVGELLHPTSLALGAQNMHWEDQGAFTGEVSPLMIKDMCQYVIIGHSERRQYFGETDEMVNRKVKAAFRHGLTPIMCVGENLAQNEEGKTEEFVSAQVRSGLSGISAEQVRDAVIAYEPIWAIGTGKAATGAMANWTIGMVVRGTVADAYGEDTAQNVRVQYGGSVKPGNIAEFMTQPEIDGALVGGASLKASDFTEIVRQGARAQSNLT